MKCAKKKNQKMIILRFWSSFVVEYLIIKKETLFQSYFWKVGGL